MSVTDLSARRWAMDERTDAHPPRAALVEMIRQIDAGDLAPRHVLICYSESEDDRISTGWLQAGKANIHEQLGLLTRVQAGLIEAGRGS